jgi:hypothetical protein
VAPSDLNGLTDALWHLTTDADARATMGATAHVRASALSWGTCATQAMAALEEAAR